MLIFMKRFILLLTSTVLLLSGKNIEATVPNISNYMKDGGTVIDIRNSQEWTSTGVIPNAKTITFFSDNKLNMDANVFAAKLDYYKIDKNKPIGLICTTGKRSAAAQKELHKIGIEVDNFTGGYVQISAH